MPVYECENVVTGEVVEIFRHVDERDQLPPNMKRIISRGHGGLQTGVLDETDADRAIPRALRHMEEYMPGGARAIEKQSGWSIEHLKKTWLSVAALLCLLCFTSKASQLTAGYSFLVNDTVTSTKLNNLVGAATVNPSFVSGQAAVTTPSASDLFLLYSVSAADLRKVTLNNAFLANPALITGQSEKAVPVSGDFVLGYDTSGAGLVKFSLLNLVLSSTNLISAQTEITNAPNNSYVEILSGATLYKFALSNLYFTVFWTNLPSYTTPIMADTIPVLDTANKTNKQMTLTVLGSELVTNATAATLITNGDFFYGYSTNDGKIVKYTFLQIRQQVTNGAPYALSNNLPTKFTSGEFGVTNGLAQVAHGLASTPQLCKWVMVCKTADVGYAVGDEIDVAQVMDSSGGTAQAGQFNGCNATNVFIQPATTTWKVSDKNSGGAPSAITASRWRFKNYSFLYP